MKLNLKKHDGGKFNSSVRVYKSVDQQLQQIVEESGWSKSRILQSAINTFIDSWEAENQVEVK